MLCLGPKKSLLSPKLELTAQGMVQHTDDQSQVWYHSAIQAPYLLDINFWKHFFLAFEHFVLQIKHHFKAD